MSQDPEEQDIRNLIYNQQVVCGGRLTTQHKDFDENSYRILKDPLSTLLAEDLISGSWTIEELSEKYGIHKKDIRNVLSGVMKDPWVLESGYIPRRTGRDEREGHRMKARYSFIPIPPNARIFDPTLGFSLLGWSEFLNDLDPSDFIPKTDEISDSYCQKISSFWGVPPEKIKTIFEKHELKYISTVYGLLPILESNELYTSIKMRIAEKPDFLVKRFRLRTLDKEHQMYRQFLMQGPGTIPELQYYVVFLHDILVSCIILKDNSNLRRFTEINRNLFHNICNIPLHTETLNNSGVLDESNISMPNELQEECKTDYSSGVPKTPSQRQNLNKIEQALKSSVLHERVSAVRQMRTGIVQPDILLLKKALKDKNLSVQMEALKVIRECLVPFPSSVLYSIAINSKERLLRYAAVDCISSIASTEALELLETVALNSPLDSAKRALLGIAQHQPKVAGPLLRSIIINTNDSQVRVAALKLIDVKEYQEIIPLVIKYLDDSQLSVRTASVSTLVPIGTTEICDALKKIYSVESSKTLQKLLLKEIEKIDPDFRSKDLNQKVNRSYGQQNLVFQVKPEGRDSHKHESAIFEREKAEKCDNILERTYSSLSEDLVSEVFSTRLEAIKYLQEHFCSEYFPLLKEGLDNDPSVQHTTLSIIRKHDLAIPEKWYLPAINSQSRIILETIGILAQIKINGGPDLLKNIIIRYHDIYAKPAILALSSYPEKESIQILKEFLGAQNMEIRSCSAEALANIKVDSAYDALIEGICDNRDSVRLCCMEALSNIQYHNIKEILQDRFNNDPSKQIRKVASDKLASMYQDTPPVNNGSDLKGLKNKHFRTRIATINQFADRKDLSVIEHIIQILKNDGSPNVRMSALKYLVNFEDKRVLDSIMASFLDSVPRLQIAMVPVIAHRGGEEGLRFLAEHIDNLNSQVRAEICQAFQNYGNSSHIQELEQLRSDPTKKVSDAAKNAVQEIQIRERKTSNDNIYNTQNSSHFYVSKTDELLVNSSDLQINVPHLSEREILSGLKSKSPKTRITTIQQLGTEKNPTIIKALILILENDRHIEVQIAALKCLENIEEPEIVDSIMASFENSFSELRIAMVPVIGHRGGEKGLDFLAEHIDDLNSHVRMEICRAFRNSGNSSHNQILEHLILDPSKDVSNTAKIAIQEILIRERKTTHDYSNNTQDISKSDIIKTNNIKINSSDLQMDTPYRTERKILNGLKNEYSKSCIEPIQQLGIIEDTEIIKRKINIMVNDRTIENQISALKYLENIENPQILTTMMASFKNSFSKLRLAMVPVIAQKGGDKGLEFLAGHLNDINSQVREEICRAFQNYGNLSHNHILEQVIFDPSKDVSNAAKIAIREIGLRESRPYPNENSKSPTLNKFGVIHIGPKIGTPPNLSKMSLYVKKDISNTTKSSIHETGIPESRPNPNENSKSPTLNKFGAIHIGLKIGTSPNLPKMNLDIKKEVSSAAKIAIQEIGLRGSRPNPNENSKSPTLNKFGAIHIRSKIGTSPNLPKINLDIKKEVSNNTIFSTHDILTHESHTNSNGDNKFPDLKKFGDIHLGPKIKISSDPTEISEEVKIAVEIPPIQNAKKRTPKLEYNLGRLELEIMQSDLRNRQNPDEQMNSAYELGISKDIRAPPLLIEALDEKNPSVLYEVLTALGELGDPSACPHLRCFLNSDKKSIRKVAENSIEKIGCPNIEENNRISEEPNHVPKKNIGNDYCKIIERFKI